MNKEYRKKLFDILDRIDELTEPLEENQGKVIEGNTKCMDGGQEIEIYEGGIKPDRDSTKRYSREFKKMVVRMHRDEGRTFDSITEEYGVSKATITRWCSDARYENKAKLDETTRELQNIRRDYEKVKEENVFLKNIVILMFGNGREAQL